jgi:hypothetical protein
MPAEILPYDFGELGGIDDGEADHCSMPATRCAEVAAIWSAFARPIVSL